MLVRSDCRLVAAVCGEPAFFHGTGRRPGARRRARGTGSDGVQRDPVGVAPEGPRPGPAPLPESVVMARLAALQEIVERSALGAGGSGAARTGVLRSRAV